MRAARNEASAIVRRWAGASASALVGCALAVSVAAAPTDRDPTFGTAGVAALPYESVYLGRLLPDGRSVMVAYTAGQPDRVVAVTAAGAVDAGFAPIVRAEGESLYDSAQFTGLAVLGDGRIAVLQFQGGFRVCRSLVTRHLGDGGLDPSFGPSPVSTPCSSGLVSTSGGELYTSFAQQSIVTGQFTSAIVRVGSTGAPVEQLARLEASPPAQLPWTFKQVALTAALQPVALVDAHGQPGVVRLLGNQLDPGYGSGGLALIGAPARFTASHMAVAPDGSVFVAGHAQDMPRAWTVVKLTPEGRPDASFGVAGVATLTVAEPDLRALGTEIVLQPDGKLLLAGTIASPDRTPDDRFVRVGLARLTVSGTPDPQFAPGGVTSLSLDRQTVLGFLALRPDGRILVGVEYGPKNLTRRTALVQLKGGDDPVARPWRERVAVEYFHAGYGHYFMTADGEEITSLDARPGSGWARTGKSFRVWDDTDASLVPVCRFWSDQTWAPKSSHFYTPYADECTKVKADPAWHFERNAFVVQMPQGTPGARTCGAGSVPLYRAYNAGKSGAPNHRYTNEAAVLDAMLAQGWIMEGEAATRVFACVPAP